MPFFELGMELLAKGAINHRIGLFAAAKHEGEVKDGEFLDLVGEDARVHRSHLQCAPLNGRHIGLIAAQGAPRKDIDLDLAARGLFDDVLESLHAQHDRVACGILVGELDGLDVLRTGHACSSQGHGSDQGLDKDAFHACLRN